MFHFSTLSHYAIYRNTLGLALSFLLYFKIMHATRGYSGLRVILVTNVFSLTGLRFTYPEIKLNVIHCHFSKIQIEKRKIIMEMN